MMRARLWGAIGIVLGVTALAAAQEPAADEPEARVPRREIRVLRDPYDLASFYRAGGPPYFTVGVPAYGPQPEEGGFYAGLRARHSIASYYRQGGGGQYSAFWQSGYGARRALGPGVYGTAYRDTIGENGDLYLFAPFLAGIGPLAGAYFR
jgi:hypothetical protein